MASTDSQPTPVLAASVNPNTRATSPTVPRIAPAMSYELAAPDLLSVTRIAPAMKATIAIGTLISRHQRHDAYSVSVPPRIKPIAAPPPEMAP
jgi:hypothetical protein